MAATYVTVAQLRSVLGVGTLYSDADLESACQTAEDTLNQYLWFNQLPVIGCTIQNKIATLVISSPVGFTAGQTINVKNVGSLYNGSHTITATYPWSQGSGSFPLFTYFFPYTYYTFPKGYSLIQYTLTGTPADENYRQVVPYGTAFGADTKETGYASTPAINQAALMLAVDVWQARQAPSSGGVSVDGVTPSPYRLGNTMLAKVNGLIAPFKNPRAMVG
jgi:hypothetical protein